MVWVVPRRRNRSFKHKSPRAILTGLFRRITEPVKADVADCPGIGMPALARFAPGDTLLRPLTNTPGLDV